MSKEAPKPPAQMRIPDLDAMRIGKMQAELRELQGRVTLAESQAVSAQTQLALSQVAIRDASKAHGEKLQAYAALHQKHGLDHETDAVIPDEGMEWRVGEKTTPLLFAHVYDAKTFAPRPVVPAAGFAEQAERALGASQSSDDRAILETLKADAAKARKLQAVPDIIEAIHPAQAERHGS